jgi:cell division protein FtsB
LGAYFLGWKALFLPLILVALQYVAYTQKEQLQDVLNNRSYRQVQKKQADLIQLLQKERKDLVTQYLLLAK